MALHGHEDVLNRRQLDCLFNSLVRLISKKIYELHITNPMWRESTVTSGFPSQRASKAENFPSCHVVNMKPSKAGISLSSISNPPSQRRAKWHYCPCYLFVSYKSIGTLHITFKFVPFCGTNIGLSELMLVPLSDRSLVLQSFVRQAYIARSSPCTTVAHTSDYHQHFVSHHPAQWMSWTNSRCRCRTRSTE